MQELWAFAAAAMKTWATYILVQRKERPGGKRGGKMKINHHGKKYSKQLKKNKKFRTWAFLEPVWIRAQEVQGLQRKNTSATFQFGTAIFLHRYLWNALLKTCRKKPWFHETVINGFFSHQNLWVKSCRRVGRLASPLEKDIAGQETPGQLCQRQGAGLKQLGFWDSGTFFAHGHTWQSSDSGHHT